jgi:hypothetical protein
MTPEVCPNCGAEVPPRSRVCPECGADEKTGWSEDARYDAAGLPDDSFDYNKFVEREFGGKRQHRVSGVKLFWQMIAALLVAGLVYLLWRRWF